MSSSVGLSTVRLEQNILAVSQWTTKQRLRWRPRLTRFVPPEVVELLSRNGVNDFLCPDCTDVTSLLNSIAGRIPASVILTQPVTTEARADQILKLASQVRLLPLIDHFYHAELLSHAAIRAGHTIGILIDMNTGALGSGIRPGYDTLRLAVAARQLPGLKVEGLTTDGGFLDELSADNRHAATATAASVLRHTLELLDRDGFKCDTSCIRDSNAVLFGDDEMHVREVSGRCAFFGDTAALEFGSIRGLEPAVTMEMHVTSRPALPLAVLNGGWTTLGMCPTLPRIDRNPGAEVIAVRSDSVVLTLACPALDLTIGDHVALIPGSAELALRLNDVRLYVSPTT